MPWESRQELLERLRDAPAAASIVTAFEAVGTSRPVTLDADGKDLLYAVVRLWLNEVGVDGLPPEILDLRNALIDNNSHDRGAGP